jgi:hypothetical protein
MSKSLLVKGFSDSYKKARLLNCRGFYEEGLVSFNCYTILISIFLFEKFFRKKYSQKEKKCG